MILQTITQHKQTRDVGNKAKHLPRRWNTFKLSQWKIPIRLLHHRWPDLTTSVQLWIKRVKFVTPSHKAQWHFGWRVDGLWHAGRSTRAWGQTGELHAHANFRLGERHSGNHKPQTGRHLSPCQTICKSPSVPTWNDLFPSYHQD